MSSFSNEETTYNKSLSFEYVTSAGITYVFYDTKYKKILQSNLNIVVSRDVIAEFENDYDVINVLYTKELNQIFNSKDEEEVSTRCMELFDMIYNSQLSSCLELLSTRPAATQLILINKVDKVSSDDISNLESVELPIDIHRRVLPILFSYDLLFFTHICMCDLFSKGEINTLHLNTLCDAIREYI